jgi:hypothetical protein
MKRKLQVLAVLPAMIMLFTCAAVLADTPPSWEEFEVLSRNKKYIALITTSGNGEDTPRSQQDFQLTVYDRKSNAVLWSCDFAHTGYRGGTLTNDGSTFVFLEQWYRHRAPVVFIYRDSGATKKITGKELKLDRSKLVKTASHQLWLESSSISNRMIKLHTYDDQDIRIEPETFEMIRHD